MLDRPRDRPVRTGIGVAALMFFTVLGFAGSDDVLAVAFGVSVNALVWAFRIALVVVPVVAGLLTWRLCVELQRYSGPGAGAEPPPADPLDAGDAEIDGVDEGGDELVDAVPSPS